MAQRPCSIVSKKHRPQNSCLLLLTSTTAPPSANVTLDDIIYISPVFQNVTVREVMSPTNGRYCYIYD
jgi:hypothetical protein